MSYRINIYSNRTSNKKYQSTDQNAVVCAHNILLFYTNTLVTTRATGAKVLRYWNGEIKLRLQYLIDGYLQL